MNKVESNRLYVFLFALSVGYISLAGASPVTIMTWQWADDGLFLRLAQSISEGDWLGKYDHLTLVKGPVFPIFIAAGSLTGIPYNLFLPIFHFMAALLFAQVVYRVTSDRYLFFIILLFLLFCPGLFIATDRVVRNTFYASLFLIYLSSLVALLMTSKGILNRCLHGVITGIIGGAVWFTREESIWIIPPTAVLIFIVFFQKKFKTESKHPSNRNGAVKNITCTVAPLMIGFLLVYGSLSLLNYRSYGHFSTVEMKEKPMQDAMVALQRVGAMFEVPYVPVPYEARHSISSVSPSFKKINPLIKVYDNKALCEALPTTCGEIAGGWFMWRLRDAVAKAGFYSTPKEAATFYTSLAEEINTACDQGELKCVRWLPPLIPPITKVQMALIPEKIWRGIRMTLYFGARKNFNFEPSGVKPKLIDAVSLLNQPLMVDEDGKVIASEATIARLTLWQWLRQSLVAIYKPVIFFGYICFVFTLFFIRTSWQHAVFPIMLASYTGAATMILILVIVDISSFPAVYHSRFPIIHLLSTIASILSIYIAAHIARLSASRYLPSLRPPGDKSLCNPPINPERSFVENSFNMKQRSFLCVRPDTVTARSSRS